MKSLLVLTCLVAVCFVATNAARLDTRALRNLLHKVKEKRQDFGEVKSCSQDSDCDDGDECFYNFCLEKFSGEFGPGPVDESCTTDADCYGYFCENSKCVECRIPGECIVNNHVCTNNTCVAPAAAGKKRSLVNYLRTLVKKWEKK